MPSRVNNGIRNGRIRTRCGQRDLALGETLVHERDLALLEVAQPAVHELRALGRRPRCEVVPLDEPGAQAPGRGVERHPGPGDAAADDEYVELFGSKAFERLGSVEGPWRDWRVHRTEATAGLVQAVRGPFPVRDEHMAL